MIIIGDLRHSIQVINKQVTKDEFGADTVIWTDKVKLRAGRKYLGGDKTIDGKEVFNSKRIVFSTFYRNITEDDRIIFDGKKYLIKSIVEIGFKEGLQIETELIND